MFANRISLWSLSMKRHSTNKSRMRHTSNREGDCPRVDSERKRKIDQSGHNSNISKVRKRRKIRANNEAPDENLDRISELPEPIIHHIFTFLQCMKDIARTTILCKKWKNTFGSYLSFDFDQKWFLRSKGVGKHNRIKSRELQKKKFMNYVDRTFATRLIPAPCIDKFRLHVTNVNGRLKDCMESWIISAVFRNTKELDVSLDTKGKHFILPSEVFLSKSISSLKLSGYLFYGFSRITMSNLRELSIKGTLLINEHVINKFVWGCPLIEDLRIVGCSGILKIAISSLMKLKRFEVHGCRRVASINISAPELECFWYHGQKDQVCKIDLKGSENLRSLNLMDYKITDIAFQDVVSNSPLLEKLVLQKCLNLKRITVLSERLRSLELIQCARLQEVIIDSPNLGSLRYCGFEMPFSAVNVLGLHEAKIFLDPVMGTSQCIAKYQSFFQEFDQSKGFKLIEYSKQNMKIYEEPGEAHLVPHTFGNLELTASLETVEKTVDNWLRESHGKSITLVSPSSQLINLMQEMIMKREDNPGCCGFYSNKCWRHYIEDVEILTLNSIQETHYVFKWKPRRIIASVSWKNIRFRGG